MGLLQRLVHTFAVARAVLIRQGRPAGRPHVFGAGRVRRFLDWHDGWRGRRPARRLSFDDLGW